MSSLGRLAIAAIVTWHVVWVLAGWAEQRAGRGGDFAVFYYAERVLADGGDPYDREALDRAARADGLRGRRSLPFFYPPPFLLTMRWAPALEVGRAHQIWFWTSEALLLGLCGLLLAAWRRVPGGLGLAALAALMVPAATIQNLVMGQVNLLVMLLAFAGLLLAERRRERAGGLLVGTACILKMSPALFVAWWLLQRRLRPALWAVAAGAAWTLVSIAVDGTTIHQRFYLEVLPGFASGSYHGLTVPIGELLNHSLPSFVAEWLPAPTGHNGLSPAARAISGALSLALLAVTAWRLRKPASDPLGRAAEIAAVGALTLLLPAYTYEHHLVWALPAVAVGIAGVASGRLGRWWPVAIGAAVAVLAVDVSLLFWGHRVLGETLGAGAAAVLKEVKLGALVTVWLGALRAVRPPGSSLEPKQVERVPDPPDRLVAG